MVFLEVQAKVSTLHAVGEVSQWLEQGLEAVAASSVVMSAHNTQATIEGLRIEL